MQVAGVKRPVRRIFDVVVLVPPVTDKLDETRLVDSESHQGGDHKTHHGPETDLDIGAWNDSKDYETVHL